MEIKTYTSWEALQEAPEFAAFDAFVGAHPQGNFFQSPEFFRFIGSVEGYLPFLLLAADPSGAIAGSLMGVVQSNGGGVKSWLSRRIIVWGGPLLTGPTDHATAAGLFRALKKMGQGQAIYAEFRNFFDTGNLRSAFEAEGFGYRDHLNYLVPTDEEAAVKKRMSSSRMRQIKSSLKAGAVIAEPENESEVMDFYAILEKLYREKVKKPLPGIGLFLQCWKSDTAKLFLVKYEGQVVGGIACPVFRGKVIYEWYVCGEDGITKGLHPSVLATWAPIEYGLQNGLDHFDFMGAGRPDEDYGVREFKARFGGDEVCYGRYEMVLNKPLYLVGKWGLKVYQKIR